MIRGFIAGLGSVLVFFAWAWRQPALPRYQHHLLTPSAKTHQQAVDQTTTILSIIERDEPWILKPNEKPSNNL